MRHSFLVKPRPPGLRCLPHDHHRQSLLPTSTRQFIKPTRPASLTDPIRTGLHRKYEDPFSVLRTAPRDNPAVWDYYEGVRKLDPQLGIIGPLRRQDHVLKEDEERGKRVVEQKARSETEREAEPITDPEHEIWRRSLEPLLVSRGGRWTITEDGTGLERYFEFKTFARAWNFMSAIVPECKANRHHPEWSNTFRTVFIRWRTHEPDSHISLLDIKLATICDEQAKAFGEVIPGAEAAPKPEEETATASTSPMADAGVPTSPEASGTSGTPDATNAATPAELSTPTTNTNTENESDKEQPEGLVAPTEQSPPETSNFAESIPRQPDPPSQSTTAPDEQVVTEPPEESVPPEPPREQAANDAQQPEHHHAKGITSTVLPLEEILKLDWQILWGIVARIRKKPCTLEEVQEEMRNLDELAARHQSGEYTFTRQLSQDRAKIDKEISDRLRFYRKVNHEWRQAKKMEARLINEREEQEREEREQRLQRRRPWRRPRRRPRPRPPLPKTVGGEGDKQQPQPAKAELEGSGRGDEPTPQPAAAKSEGSGRGDERTPQPAAAESEEGGKPALKPPSPSKPGAKPEQKPKVLVGKEGEKPPVRIPWFQSVFRQP
ncbi:pterin 4 alpha carbinolamine dehydratase-domain-containing protein [Cercophora samala]|uniref:4a-hydroxytetrahydrobiopterin dehydratase n=1 Tax=Cercophora samala TaxID=330535 RepID=A0AA39Z991_9PEZI|nr:pterin 4 alpha carbinolamine dehydratase-domain-containing protein [Cercophora samala]